MNEGVSEVGEKGRRKKRQMLACKTEETVIKKRTEEGLKGL